jgi:hypothetical protein
MKTPPNIDKHKAEAAVLIWATKDAVQAMECVWKPMQQWRRGDILEEEVVRLSLKCQELAERYAEYRNGLNKPQADN